MDIARMRVHLDNIFMPGFWVLPIPSPKKWLEFFLSATASLQERLTTLREETKKKNAF